MTPNSVYLVQLHILQKTIKRVGLDTVFYRKKVNEFNEPVDDQQDIVLRCSSLFRGTTIDNSTGVELVHGSSGLIEDRRNPYLLIEYPQKSILLEDIVVVGGKSYTVQGSVDLDNQHIILRVDLRES